LTTPAGAQIDYGLVLHMGAPSYVGCDEPSVADDAMDCDAVDEVGDDLGSPFGQWVWVFAYGYPNMLDWPASQGIGGCQFGIVYDGTVLVTSWQLCTGGQEIPQNDALGVWPDNQTGNAVIWPGGNYNSTPPEYFAKIGYFTLLPGSMGRMTIMEDPRSPGFYLFSDGQGGVHPLPDETRSSANVGGPTDPENLGRKSCAEAVPTVSVSWTQIKNMY
jgi:hypothetical protein